MIIELEAMLKKIDRVIRQLKKPLGIKSAFNLVYNLFPKPILASLLVALFSTIVFAATFLYYRIWIEIIPLRLLLLNLSIMGFGFPYLFTTYVLIESRVSIKRQRNKSSFK